MAIIQFVRTRLVALASATHRGTTRRHHRGCFLGRIGGIALLQACGANAEAAPPRWHCDVPTLAPDGVRVAYLQWDAPLVRVVVVNLDQPGRTMYFNLGDGWADPITIVWKTTQKIELRQGATAFALFTVDPPAESSVKTSLPTGHVSLPPADPTVIRERLQHQLPHRSIRMLNGDEAGRRVLLLADTASDPGRFFVYDRGNDLLFEVARRKTPLPLP